MKKIVLGTFGAMLLANSVMGAEVSIGSKAAPYDKLYGFVAKIASKGPPTRLERTRYEVIFLQVYVRGEIETGVLAKPKEGAVKEVYIGGVRIPLVSKDLSRGFLDTRDFGKITVYFSHKRAGLFGELVHRECFLAVTDEQMKAIQAVPKIRPLPANDTEDMVDFLKRSSIQFPEKTREAAVPGVHQRILTVMAATGFE